MTKTITPAAYRALFDKVKTYSPYTSYSKQSDYDLRSSDNKLSLTPFGRKDWTANQIEADLITIAKSELGFSQEELAAVHRDFADGPNDNSKPQVQDNRQKAKVPARDASAVAQGLAQLEVSPEQMAEAAKAQAEQLSDQERNSRNLKRYFTSDLSEERQKELFASYLQERGFELLNQPPFIDYLMRNLGLRVKPVRDYFEIMVPIHDSRTLFCQLNRIGITSEGQKLSKKLYGKNTKSEINISSPDGTVVRMPNATYTGLADLSIGTNQVYIMEGLEDALSVLEFEILSHPEAPAVRLQQTALIITNGTANLKKIASRLELVQAALTRNNKTIADKFSDKIDSGDLKLATTPQFTAILDNDSHLAGLKAARTLPGWVKKLMPCSISIDANTALAASRDPATPNAMISWWASLEEIKDRQFRRLDLIADVKESVHYQIHRDFMLDMFCDAKRDLFSDQIMVKIERNSPWEMLVNLIDSVKGAARTQTVWSNEKQKEVPLYQPSAFKEHLQFYHKNDAGKGELLITVPDWDGRDRLSEITSRIRSSRYTQDELHQIIREWVVKSWVRIWDTTTEQHFVILTGAQGCGKDVLIRALTGGYGDYAQPVALGNDETKMSRSVSELIVANVPEFDKLKFSNVEMLKDIITKPVLKFDQKYVQGDVKAKNRCSFIGSANIEQLLRDSTGNRRYRILPLDSIELARNMYGAVLTRSNYPGDDLDPEKDWNRRQLVAQYRAMAEMGEGNYCVSPELRAKISQKTADIDTPEDVGVEIAEAWYRLASDWLYTRTGQVTAMDRGGTEMMRWDWIRDNQVIANVDAMSIINDIAKLLGVSQGLIRRKLVEVGIKNPYIRLRGYLGIKGPQVRGLYKIDERVDLSGETFMPKVTSGERVEVNPDGLEILDLDA